MQEPTSIMRGSKEFSVRSKGGETSLALGVSYFQSGEGRERRICRASKEGREPGSETKDPDEGKRTGEEKNTTQPSSWS